MSEPARYRVGGKQPHNIYMITAEHPEGIPIGHACKPDPEKAAQIVEALNAYAARESGGNDHDALP